MGTGICVCGLNGTGKSTLGKALAEKLNFYFIDNEELFFSKTDPHNIYAFSRTHKEVEKLLLNKVKAHENFVFAAVIIEVPENIRLQRVKDRSFQKFGNRMLPGGNLYKQEKEFLDKVKSRTENEVEEWVQSLSCAIIRVDGTKSIKENTNFIIEQTLISDNFRRL